MGIIFSSDTVSAVVAYTICWLIGMLICMQFHSLQKIYSLLIFVSLSVGLMISSGVVFAAIILFPSDPGKYILISHFLILSSLMMITAFRTEVRQRFPDIRWTRHSYVNSGFILIAILAVMFILFHALKSPFGTGMDVWAIWKLKSSFIFRSPEHWERIFSKSLYYSHPEYPILYPLSICWSWFVMGRELQTSPLIITTFCAIAQCGIVYFAPVKKRWCAAAGSLLIISAPHWSGMAASQYCDPLIAFFMLAVICVLHSAYRSESNILFITAGFICGIGSFAKNEMICFLAVICFVILVWDGLKKALVFTAGSVPMICMGLIFKMISQDKNHMLSIEQTLYIVKSGNLPDRIATSLSYAFMCASDENSWVYAWFLIIPVLAVALFRDTESKINRLSSIIILQFVAYMAVYVFTRLDLEYHLINSTQRMLYQIFPSAVFVSVLFWSGLDMNKEKLRDSDSALKNHT